MSDASQGDLGRPISSHKGSLGGGGWLWYVGALCILSGFFWVFAAFKSAVLGGEGSTLEQVSTGGCSFVIGAILLIVPVIRLRQTVDIYEHGFVHTRLFGTKTVRRADVANVNRTVYRSRRRGTRDVIAVTLRDGGRVKMVGMADPDQITTFLHSWVSGGAPPDATPPAGGGWSPPGGGAPPGGGGWTPPASGGGWTPPSGGAPPAGGGWAPPT